MTVELRMLRINLEQERKRLIEELETHANGNSYKAERLGSSFYRIDEAADRRVDLERLLALEAQKRIRLVAVEHALEKIDSGTYGICENCGQPIDQERLEIVPYAVNCIACSVVKKSMQ